MEREKRLPRLLSAAFLVSGMILFLSGCSRENVWRETIALTEVGKEREELKTEVEAESDPEAETVLQIQWESGKTGRVSGMEEGATTGNREPVLLFGGDIYLSDHVLRAYDEAGGIGGVLDAELQEIIGKADLFMANQEFPFSDRGTPAEDKQFTFRLPPERVSLMQEIGTDLVTIANNHALDYGSEALSDTCHLLDEAGIGRVGAGADLDEAKRIEIREIKGKKIGFLGASRVFPVGSWAAGPSHPGMMSAYDAAPLLEQIRQGKEACDYLVLYLHWGIERNTSPEEYQRQLGRQCIEAGADLVIGSHPHVLQGIEYYHGKPILYSLGNFIFGSAIPETMLAEVTLQESGDVALRLIPATSGAGYTRCLETEQYEAFYRKIQELSFDVHIDENGFVYHSP